MEIGNEKLSKSNFKPRIAIMRIISIPPSFKTRLWFQFLIRFPRSSPMMESNIILSKKLSIKKWAAIQSQAQFMRIGEGCYDMGTKLSFFWRSLGVIMIVFILVIYVFIVLGDITGGSISAQTGDSKTDNWALYRWCMDIVIMAPVTYMPIIGATYLWWFSILALFDFGTTEIAVQ
jgi:hypothetical protein